MTPQAASLVRSATDQDVPQLVALWTVCGLTRAQNHAPTDIAFARRGPHSDVLVLERNNRLIASVMVGHDGHRGWVYYLAVHPDYQRQGVGKAVMAEAERWLTARGVWKLHLMVRQSNLAVQGFYESLGFAESDVTTLTKSLRPMPHIDSLAPT